MRLKELGEFGLIEQIKRLAKIQSPRVLVGIDDDAAIVRAGRATLVLTTDAFVEEIHFRFDYFSPFDLGWRLMAANLSDMAAMGAQPLFALADIAIPAEADAERVLDVYRGMIALGDRFGVSVVGGDTTSSPDRWFLALSLLGEAKGGSYALRSSARNGELLVVTGWLGNARAGLELLANGTALEPDDILARAHRRPEPRLLEGQFLVRSAGVRAMIDISDGLSSEVHHICRMSRVGAVVYADRLPVHPRLQEFARLQNRDPLSYALHGGEEFELLFTVPPERWPALERSWRRRFPIPITPIGEIRAQQSGVLLRTSKGDEPLIPGGWQHFQTPLREPKSGVGAGEEGGRSPRRRKGGNGE
ncbi:MAG: thiamine-phosphate kinase [candidate division KSB1 bacterium]|nr:thiamine-phosphate kinase [candidate division KSB1 bacterium]